MKYFNNPSLDIARSTLEIEEMKRSLLTDWAKTTNPANTALTGQNEIIKATHDILALAADKGWDVTIVCGTLSHAFCDEQTRQVTNGISLGESIDKVLWANGNVRLLVTRPIEQDGPLAASIRELIRRYHVGSAESPLIIESSEDKKFNRHFPRFVIAHPRDRTTGIFWINKKPHSRGTINATLFGPEDAKTVVPGLLKLYDKKIGCTPATNHFVLC